MRISGMDSVLCVQQTYHWQTRYHPTKSLTAQLQTYLSCECNSYKLFTQLDVQVQVHVHESGKTQCTRPRVWVCIFAWSVLCTKPEHGIMNKWSHHNLLYHGIPGNGCFSSFKTNFHTLFVFCNLKCFAKTKFGRFVTYGSSAKHTSKKQRLSSSNTSQVPGNATYECHYSVTVALWWNSSVTRNWPGTLKSYLYRTSEIFNEHTARLSQTNMPAHPNHNCCESAWHSIEIMIIFQNCIIKDGLDHGTKYFLPPDSKTSDELVT